MRKLAIIITHPIQYYSPVFRLLNERKKIGVKVFYTWGEAAKGKLFDPGFGKLREWDIPLLEGYDYEFVDNISKDAGSHHYNGIINPALIQILDKWDPDTILIFGWKFKSHFKIMRHFKGKIPILFRGDSTLLDEKDGFSIKKYLRRLSLKWVYRFVDFALYVGINNKAYFVAHGLSEKQLIFAPHVIDNDRFSNNKEDSELQALQLKGDLHIPLAKPCVLFAGKLESKKNPLFFVEAAKEFPEIHFIIAGNGKQESLIKEEGKELPNLTIIPFQNQSAMPVIYRLSDIFVLPSKGPQETWGLSINEAMACERIIIASNKCGGAIDLIKDGENGFIIEPFYKKLSMALHNLMMNQDKWEVMKKKSFEIVQNYSPEYLCEKIEEIVAESTIPGKL